MRPPISATKRFLIAVALVLATNGVTLLWYQLNRTRTAQGPLLIRISLDHGIHLLDLVFLVVWLTLVALLLNLLTSNSFDRK